MAQPAATGKASVRNGAPIDDGQQIRW